MMDNKELYKLSKRVYREGILHAQLQSAGSDQARFLERIDKDKMQRMPDVIMKILYCIYLIALTTIPIFSLNTIFVALNSNIDLNWVTFVGSMSVSGFFLLQPSVLLIFSFMFTWGLMSGGPYKWLHTLPLGKRDIEKISFFTVLRNLNIQLVVMFFIFPVGVIISIVSTLSSQISILSLVLLVIVSLLISLVNIVFGLSLIVLVSRKIAVLLGDEDGSNTKKATALRIISMLIYMIASMGISYAIQFAIAQIPNLYMMELLSGGSANTLNLILSFIPFPFAGGYLVTVFAMDIVNAPIMLVAGAFIGNVIFVFLTYLLYKKALSTLRSIASTELRKYDMSKKEIKVEDIEVKTSEPAVAFLKRDFAIITREMSSIMIIIMPFMIPIYLALIPFNEAHFIGNSMLSEVVIIALFYVTMVIFMLIIGLTNIESGGQTITASLPISVRDQVNAKIPHFMFTIPLSLIVAFLTKINSIYFLELMTFILVFLPIIPILGVAGIFMKAFLFGKMKNKIVLEEIRNEAKFLKYAIAFVFVFGLMGVFIFISYFGYLALGIAEVVAFILLYIVYHFMFPEKKKKFAASSS